MCDTQSQSVTCKMEQYGFSLHKTGLSLKPRSEQIWNWDTCTSSNNAYYVLLLKFAINYQKSKFHTCYIFQLDFREGIFFLHFYQLHVLTLLKDLRCCWTDISYFAKLYAQINLTSREIQKKQKILLKAIHFLLFMCDPHRYMLY